VWSTNRTVNPPECKWKPERTIQRFNDSTIQRFNDSTIQRFNSGGRQQQWLLDALVTGRKGLRHWLFAATFAL
jgi:hypothetical protein